MLCYYSCTLPPSLSLELPHESSHVGVIYVLCLSIMPRQYGQSVCDAGLLW